MKIDIEVQGFTLTNPLRGYVQRRLCRTLCWYTDRIERIALVLEEIKGSLLRIDLLDDRFSDDRQPQSRDRLFHIFLRIRCPSHAKPAGGAR
jgi:hypothetical protein